MSLYGVLPEISLTNICFIDFQFPPLVSTSALCRELLSSSRRGQMSPSTSEHLFFVCETGGGSCYQTALGTCQHGGSLEFWLSPDLFYPVAVVQDTLEESRASKEGGSLNLIPTIGSSSYPRSTVPKSTVSYRQISDPVTSAVQVCQPRGQDSLQPQFSILSQTSILHDDQPMNTLKHAPDNSDRRGRVAAGQIQHPQLTRNYQLIRPKRYGNVFIWKLTVSYILTSFQTRGDGHPSTAASRGLSPSPGFEVRQAPRSLTTVATCTGANTTSYRQKSQRKPYTPKKKDEVRACRAIGSCTYCHKSKRKVSHRTRLFIGRLS